MFVGTPCSSTLREWTSICSAHQISQRCQIKGQGSRSSHGKGAGNRAAVQTIHSTPLPSPLGYCANHSPIPLINGIVIGTSCKNSSLCPQHPTPAAECGGWGSHRATWCPYSAGTNIRSTMTCKHTVNTAEQLKLRSVVTSPHGHLTNSKWTGAPRWAWRCIMHDLTNVINSYKLSSPQLA